MKIADCLAHNARIMPNQTALVWQDTETNWRELDQKVNRLANGLLSLGIEPGDRVVTLAGNCAEWVEIHLALSRMGAVSVPVMPRSVGKELVHILNDVAATIFIYEQRALPPEFHQKTELPRLKAEICLEGPYREALAYSDILRSSSPNDPQITVDPDSLASIKYTSGTTGVPKGCCRTHRQTVMAALLYHANIPHHPHDRATISSPLAAGFAVSLLNTFMLAGVTTYLLPKFDPVRLLETIEDKKITLAYAITSTFDELLNVPELEQFDLSSIRLFTGSSATQNSLTGFMRLRRHPTFQGDFLNAYGSTEAGGYVVYHLPQEYAEELASSKARHRFESIGRPGLLCDVQCMDDNMHPLPPGEVGELAIRSPLVFAGYWNRPAETAAVFRDGWLMTGDLAQRDEEGFYYLAGRKRDMIKTGGINVYPAEIEAAISLFPKVDEVAVLGVPDVDWGEKVIACIVASDFFTLQELLAHLDDKLASYKRPKEIVFVTSIPKNETGKVVKRELKA